MVLFIVGFHLLSLFAVVLLLFVLLMCLYFDSLLLNVLLEICVCFGFGRRYCLWAGMFVVCFCFVGCCVFVCVFLCFRFVCFWLLFVVVFCWL